MPFNVGCKPQCCSERRDTNTDVIKNDNGFALPIGKIVYQLLFNQLNM